MDAAAAVHAAVICWVPAPETIFIPTGTVQLYDSETLLLLKANTAEPDATGIHEEVVPAIVPLVGVLSCVSTTSSEEDVPQAAELIVQRKRAVPGVVKTTEEVADPGLETIAGPLMTDHEPESVPGEFADIVKVLPQALWSAPACDEIRLSSVTVMGVETAVQPLLPVTVTL